MERNLSYSTLKEISKRLGVSPKTVLRWFMDRGLPMYRRKRGIYRYWYTNERLIVGWELAQADLDRRHAGLYSTKGKDGENGLRVKGKN